MRHNRSESAANAALVAGSAVAVRLPRQRAARRVVRLGDALPGALAALGAVAFILTAASL